MGVAFSVLEFEGTFARKHIKYPRLSLGIVRSGASCCLSHLTLQHHTSSNLLTYTERRAADTIQCCVTSGQELCPALSHIESTLHKNS